jgi:hypothetical protein
MKNSSKILERIRSVLRAEPDREWLYCQVASKIPDFNCERIRYYIKILRDNGEVETRLEDPSKLPSYRNKGLVRWKKNDENIRTGKNGRIVRSTVTHTKERRR